MSLMGSTSLCQCQGNQRCAAVSQIATGNLLSQTADVQILPCHWLLSISACNSTSLHQQAATTVAQVQGLPLPSCVCC